MSVAELKTQAAALSFEERIDLIGEIWDSLAGAPDSIPVTEAQRIELDRRLAAHLANPHDVIPWDQVESELDARLRQRQ